MVTVLSTRCRNYICQKPLTGFDLKKGFCMACRSRSYSKQHSIMCVLCPNIVAISDTKNNNVKFCSDCLQTRIKIRRIRYGRKPNTDRCVFRSGYCKLCKEKLVKNKMGYYPMFCSLKHRRVFMVYNYKKMTHKLVPFPCRFCGKITPKRKYSYTLYCNKVCHGRYKYKVFRETHGH